MEEGDYFDEEPYDPLTLAERISRARDLSYRLQSAIKTLEMEEQTAAHEDVDLAEFEDEEIEGDIDFESPDEIVQRYLIESGITFQDPSPSHGSSDESTDDDAPRSRESHKRKASDSDSQDAKRSRLDEEDDEDDDELVGDDAEFIKKIKQKLSLEECRIIVRRSFAYFERVYRYRRREAAPVTPGEEPLFPETIPFTRMLHRAVIGLSLPVILGQKAYDLYGQQIASEFNLITGYKAAILIMARGNGKTMGMIDIIPYMILFQRKFSQYSIFITCPGQTLVKGILDQIKEQITIHINSDPTLTFATERPTTTNASTFEWSLSDGRSFIVQCVPATDNQVRGQHPNLLIVDEARKVHKEVMDEAIAPIITDSDSMVFYISTPAAAGHTFDTQVRLALAELRDPNCANPVMYPLLMTLVCDEHQECDTPSKCMCGMCFLQPWKPISMIRPVIDAKRACGDISALECEILGLPPTFEGSCFRPAHIDAFERADPSTNPPSASNPTIIMSIDPTMNGKKSDLSVISVIEEHRAGDKDQGISFAVSHQQWFILA